MAEETAQPAAPEQPAQPEGPTIPELQSTLEAERQRAAKAEYYAQSAAAELSRLQAAQQAPPQAMPLGSLSEKILSDPAQADAMIQDKIAQEAEKRMRASMRQIEARMSTEAMNQRTASALAGIQARYPELSEPVNQARFAGALTEAKFVADSQGLSLTPEQLTDRAARIFRQLNPPQAGAPTYVEGGARPNVAQMPAEGQRQAQPTFLDEAYGAAPGEINVGPVDWKSYTKEFTRAENERRLKNGINTDRLRAAS